MHIVYDRGRYTSISDAEIEVAFRYELSQDAEELKDLGAVNDDYRPLTWAEAKAAVSSQSTTSPAADANRSAQERRQQ
jgi:hypothetical protein